MAIDLTVPAAPDVTSTKARVISMKVHNSTYDGYDPNTDEPIYKVQFHVTLEVAAAEPMLNGSGDPILNEFGLPCYIDTHKTRLVFKDPADLTPFLSGVWADMMTAAEGLLQGAMNDGVITQDTWKKIGQVR